MAPCGPWAKSQLWWTDTWGLLLFVGARGCHAYFRVAPHAASMWGDSKLGEAPAGACVKQRGSGSQKIQECIDLPWMVPFVPWTKSKLLPFLVAKNAGVYRLPCLAHKSLSLSFFNKHLEAQTCAKLTHNSLLHKRAIINPLGWSAVVLD